MTRRRLALPLLIVAASVFAGCTAAPTGGSVAQDAPGDAGQSVAEACAIVDQSIDDATAAFAAASPEDAQAVVSAMSDAADRLATASKDVTNDQVAALLPPLQETYAKVSEVMGDLVGGDVSKMAELSDLSASYQEAAGAYAELCGGA